MDRIVAAKAFIGVAELGSFSGAARAQGVSPSLITKYIQGLEQSLGTTLFQRSTRRVVLTEAGSVYRQHWRKILLDIDAADAAIGADQHAIQGTLRIGAPAAFGRIIIAPLAMAFSHDHPGVSIDLLFNNATVSPLAENLDLLFRPGTGGDDAGITARKLTSFPRVLCAAPSYFDRHGTPSSIYDLVNHLCIHRARPGQAGRTLWDFVRDGKDVQVPIDGPIRANTADAVISASLHGQGLIYQPECLVRDYLKSGQLRVVELDAKPVEVPFSAFWQTGRTMPARVRAFIDHCARAMRAAA